MERQKPSPERGTNKFPLPPNKKPKRTGWRKWVYFIWLSLAIVVFGLAFLFFGVSQGLFGKMPDVAQLDNPDIYVASEIYSADNVLLGKFEKEKVKPVTYQELPAHLVYALQAKEDERFKEHSGIDVKSILRAIWFRGERGGGSTITQQLAKLLFTEAPSSNPLMRIPQKLKEWVVAVELEKRYTKEEIIQLYFNKFDFNNEGNGIEMASNVYFNKHAKDLTLPEAAMFVAMLEAPSSNSPLRNPERATRRRNVVLQQMLETGYLDQSTYQQAVDTPLKTNYTPVKDQEDGNSAYYKFHLRKEIDPIIAEYEKKTGKKLNLFRDGLKIYTTLDSRMQRYGEEAVKEHMTELQKSFDSEQRGRKSRPFYFLDDKEINSVMMAAVKRTGRYKRLKAEGVPEDSIMIDFKTPTKMSRFTWNGEEEVVMTPWDSIRYHKQIAQAGLMSMVPGTGEIKAWVGGINWKHFQYDHIKQGKRQVGSTFKPFVYATAIMNLNYTPCTVISNETFTKGSWSVSEGGGSYTVKEALAKSLNPTAVRVMDKVGVKNVARLTNDLGITEKIPNDLATALGTTDITIYEMVGAYSTFANYGNYIRPEMIWRIEDTNGRVIKDVQTQEREVMNEKYAYTMIELMRGVAEFGTASSELRRRGIEEKVEIAGKTGTTQNNSDGWFMGITPNLATGVWVGWEDRATHFASTGEGQGAKMALPIWAIFMKKVWADPSLGIAKEDKFIKPTDWTNGCEGLHGLNAGYGDEGSLQSMEQLRNPTQTVPEGGSPQRRGPAKREENINDIINSNEDVDFNK